jgi:hypothetical protein
MERGETEVFIGQSLLINSVCMFGELLAGRAFMSVSEEGYETCQNKN